MNNKLNIQWLIQNIKPVLDSINQPITAVDHEGRFVYYNLASARMDGTDPDEVIGRHLLEINKWLTPEQSTLLQCLKDKKQITNSYQAFQEIGGHQIYYLHSVTPLFDHEGELIGAIEIGRTVQEIPSKITPLQKDELPAIITKDPFLLQEINKLEIFAQTDLPIILYGETGTGKELFAQRAHALSSRNTRPMISLNCAAIPDTLLESTLFGTVRGAYTGAENRKGLLALANGGTLFLDEINSMPISLQSKLLRVFQDGNYFAVGSQTTEHTDIRIITALNQTPAEAINEGRLREDLYYRLNIGEISISPLRDRPKDIPLLAQFFIVQLAPKLKPQVTMLDKNVLAVLTKHPWPGNVRELSNAISRSLILHKNGSRLKNIFLTQQAAKIHSKPTNIPPLPRQLENEEKKIIQDQLIIHNGNITATAKSLGVPRTTLNARIKKLGISIDK